MIYPDIATVCRDLAGRYASIRERDVEELTKRAFELEAAAQNGCAKTRLSLQPQFELVLSRLAARGYDVPTRLRNLNTTLKEEAIEDMFDNLPV